MTDLIIRGARVVDATQDHVADVAIKDGMIEAVGPNLSQNAAAEFDASGYVLMPGGIDPHVHFNEPGRVEWEGIATGSEALARGGVTTYFDMPLNSIPVTTTAAAFDLKRQAIRARSRVHGYLWGGLIPGSVDEMMGMALLGAVGFKAFMSNSGLPEFPAVDDATLFAGMLRAAELGKIVAVHAENDSITAALAHEARSAGRVSARAYLDSRPVIAELEAVQRALFFAGEARCKLHIVHVSSGHAVELIARARADGVDVTCETCPHYLVLTDEDVERLGAVAKCAPPIRNAHEQAALWTHLLSGAINMIASDHSPAPPELKASADFFAVWGGIAGCQFTLPLLLTYGYHQRGMRLSEIAAVTSRNVAERFGLRHKGRIMAGMDADLALVDIDATWRLAAADLAYRHRISPYVGMEMRGKVLATWVKGVQVYGPSNDTCA